MSGTIIKRKWSSIRLVFAILFLLLPLIPSFCDFLDDTEIVPGIRFWGADLELRYKGLPLAAPLVTRLCVLAGGGYEDPGYYRNYGNPPYPDGSRYTPPTDNSQNLALYKRANFTWGLGIRQGILFDERKKDNLLEAHFLLRGRYDNDIQADSPSGSLIFDSPLPDKNGILQNSLVTGFYFNTVVVHPEQRKRTGIKTDMSVEYAPAFLGNNIKGLADFERFTFDFRSYLTILDLTPPDAHENLFNMYFGNRIVFDVLAGSAIPINARQSIGSRKMAPDDAVGYSVRGVDDRRFDSFMKLIVNTDVRMNFPTLPLFGIVPGAVVYFDIGLFDNLDYNMDIANLTYTTGIGESIYILGFDAVLYESYFINENRFMVSFYFDLQF